MTEDRLLELTAEFYLDAQNLFGEMTSGWVFNGIEFNDMSPHLKYYPETGHVNISLSFKVIDDEPQLAFQLSHEMCHLLHPSREFNSETMNETLVINEGISTYFSILKTGPYYESENVIIDNLREYNAKYYYAYESMKELMQIDADAIKKLRRRSPLIDKLTEIDFDTLNIALPAELKRKLLMPFSKL